MTDNVHDGNALARVGTAEWGSGCPPAEAVVEAIASATGQHPLDIEPVQNYVDTDALEELVESESTNGGVEVRFEYDEMTVRVDASGTVDVLAADVDE
jgi:hypothetical protein